MRIYGTKLEITSKRDGTLVTNILNPSEDSKAVLLDRESRGILMTMLRVCRKHESDTIRLGKTAVRYLARQTMDNLSTLGYGTTWNFNSVVEDPSVSAYISDVMNNRADEFCESKTFTVAEEKPKRTRRPRTPKSVVVDNTVSTESVAPKKAFDMEALRSACAGLINFFSEFDFEPNFRFVNTLSRNCNSLSSAKKYVHNYFALIDSPYVNDVDNKMRSAEFESIYDKLANNITEKTVNKRFSIYYGSQGTGKTTRAIKEADGNVVVCNNSMLPADLMHDFDFDDGKATFKSSALYDAMVNGKKIVLDEINLLPFESLRFLQGIVDGKESFVYKNEEIKIADGFKIIGTMNLFVNGMAYALPSPLVDRCENIEEFSLSANDLVYSIA